VTSRRGKLYVMSDALELGDWRIPYSEIDEAILFSIRQMFIPCYVLCVTSKGKTYQFGLNPGSFWEGNLPFPIRRERHLYLTQVTPIGSIWRRGRLSADPHGV